MSNIKKTHPLMTVLYRASILFTAMELLITALYFLIIVPMVETPLSDILGGGLSLSRRGFLFLIALAIASVWTLLKKEPSSKALSRYIATAALTYTVQIALLACVHGFYLATYYNEYIGIESPILRGPSFMLSFAALFFSLLFPLIGYLLRAKNLPTLAKLILHCTALMLLAYLTYAVFADAFAHTSSFLILCAVFVAGYLLTCVLYFYLHGAKKQEENDRSDYTPLYHTEKPTPDKVGAKPKSRK